VTAHTFDHGDRARALFELESVELRGAPLMYGALYLGWIASRLGWKQAPGAETPGGGGDGGAGTPRPYRDQQGRRVTTLHAVPAALEDGLGVTFRFFERPEIELTAELGGCVTITGTEGESSREVFNIPPDGAMLLGEIDAARNEAVYTAALDLLKP
jgi:glucose-6-phosphate dehydrogenase assembly protein OpcA